MSARPLNELVMLVPASSEAMAAAERAMGGISVLVPEGRTGRRAWLGMGTLVSKGCGRVMGACVEHTWLKPGSRVFYDTRCEVEDVTVDGVKHVVLPSKGLLCVLDTHIPPGPKAIKALGWWAFVEDASEEFARFHNQNGRRIMLAGEHAPDFEDTAEVTSYGGKVLSLGGGTIIGPDPTGKRAARAVPHENVRRWWDVREGERLAFNAQTAVSIRLGRTWYYFASCASEVAGFSSYVWSL